MVPLPKNHAEMPRKVSTETATDKFSHDFDKYRYAIVMGGRQCGKTLAAKRQRRLQLFRDNARMVA